MLELLIVLGRALALTLRGHRELVLANLVPAVIRRYAAAICGSAVLLVITAGTSARAQTAPDAPAVGTTTVFPHAADGGWWLSGQVNLISQTHGRFTSPYEGDNSLRPEREQALSRLWTL